MTVEYQTFNRKLLQLILTIMVRLHEYTALLLPLKMDRYDTVLLLMFLTGEDTAAAAQFGGMYGPGSFYNGGGANTRIWQNGFGPSLGHRKVLGESDSW